VNILVAILFVFVALVNLAPVMGVVSGAQIQAAYGVVLDDPSLVVLMRHRAVLFGVVGALLLAAAFKPPVRPIAVAAGLLSMSSFAVIVWLEAPVNSQIQRVVIADLVALVALVVAAWLGRPGKSGTPSQ
jgi:hypothetical protein